MQLDLWISLESKDLGNSFVIVYMLLHAKGELHIHNNFHNIFYNCQGGKLLMVE